MRDAARHMTLTVAACLGMALPSVCSAQPASPQDLVVDLWSDFSETCVPYLVNPQKALSDRPIGVLGFQEHKSPNGSVVHRHEGFLGNYDRVRTVEVHIGRAAAMIACEVYRVEDMQPFPATAVTDAVRQLTSQSPDLVMTGGEMKLTDAQNTPNDQTNFYNGEEAFSVFILEGALPGRLEFIEVEIADGLFGLYVSATIARDDWK